jgi:hypothetical protein
MLRPSKTFLCSGKRAAAVAAIGADRKEEPTHRGAGGLEEVPSIDVA